MRSIAVIPAYQAASSVGSVVTALLRLWPESGPGVIVVDDGSTDDTSEQAESAGALVVRHPRNLGKGAALRSGFECALEIGASVAVSVDADGQHPAEEAVRLALHPAPDRALVLGVRDLGAAGAPRSHRFSNGISNFFLSLFAGERLLDTQCGLRRYPVAASLALGGRDSGYAYEAEMIVRCKRAGWDIVQVLVSVVYSADSRRASHFHVIRDPARIVGRVLHTVVTAGAPR